MVTRDPPNMCKTLLIFIVIIIIIQNELSLYPETLCTEFFRDFPHTPTH
jgi:hypothetical protein